MYLYLPQGFSGPNALGLLAIRSCCLAKALRMGASILASLLLALMTYAANAQVKTADPAERGLKLSDFPRTIELAKGIYGYEDIRAPGFTTVCMFVVGTEGVLLADGQWTPQQTKRLVDTIASITPKPIKWYVVGSDHADHTGGNSMLPKDVRYIVHRTSKEQLERDAVDAARTPNTPPVVVPPTAMVSNEEVVDVGGRQVQVLFLGRAHTGGDLVVYVPSDKIMFMSEVYFNRVFPALRTGFAMEWIQTIDGALKMDVMRFIPGHGFIEEPARSREQLVEFRSALVYINAEVRSLFDRGLSAEDAIAQANWGPYSGWMLADSQGAVAIKNVYKELAAAPK